MAIRVLQVGLGPIGAGIARQLEARDGFELVGGADIRPDLAGKDLAEVCGLPGGGPARPVQADLGEALETLRPDAAVVTTGSSLERVAPILERCLAAPVAVVSTTEELAYPWRDHPETAAELDARARDGGRALLGTGVNPGFAMDVLPLMLTGVCERVDAVTVRRVQDAGSRRLPFQRKVGAGLDPDTMLERMEAGTVRHVGMAESIAMIAAGLGWRLDRISDEIEPVVARQPVSSGEIEVAAGQVAGIRQEGIGRQGERVRVRLLLEAYLGAPESYDEVEIEGSPPLRSRVTGGIPGDIATASVVVNCLPRVLAAPPGLVTMKDLPPPACWPGGAG